MATRSAKGRTCPECGGMARGRGYSHVTGCSRATKTSGSRGRLTSAAKARRIAASAAGTGNNYAIDLRRLRGMGVDFLMDLRSRLDALVKSKAPEIEKRIKMMAAQLKAIKK